MKLVVFVLIILLVFASRLPMGEALESARSPASVTYNEVPAASR